MGYIKGSDRSQGLLLPETLDDYVAENNAVRAIAASGAAGFREAGVCACRSSGDGPARL